MELQTEPLSWQDGTPHSARYGDIYYKVGDGLAETRHIFLAGNKLPERLKAAATFTVAETGFGTGLNFLALWQEWANLPEPRPRLHYITTELHPLSLEELQQAHAGWPELAELASQLRAVYPPAISGPHARWLADGNIRIDFLWGDAASMLAQYQLAAGEAKVDAWFLDGFAPARNSGMWHAELYSAMAKLSYAGSTLATFTAAGEVRRGLQEAGFAIRKAPGHGHKRHMTVGEYEPSEGFSLLPPSGLTRGSSRGSELDARVKPGQGIVSSNAGEAIVIGAGIAGVMSAWRLAKQGYQVTLLEAGEAICSGASGNPASALTPYYPAKWNARGRVLASGFATLRHLISYLQAEGHRLDGVHCGTLMLNLGEDTTRGLRLAQWQNALELPPEIRRTVMAAEASEIAGIPLNYGGWFYPQGGWLIMRQLCEALLADAGEAVTLHLKTKAEGLRHKAGNWHIGDAFSAPVVVLANAREAAELVPELELHAVHGQLLHFTPPAELASLRCVINGGHALMPVGGGKLSWGSSFRHDQAQPDILEEETGRLLVDLLTIFPELDVNRLQSGLSAWAGIRCSLPGRIPAIGQVPGHPVGLYLHLGHGSRGALGAGVGFATIGSALQQFGNPGVKD